MGAKFIDEALINMLNRRLFSLSALGGLALLGEAEAQSNARAHRVDDKTKALIAAAREQTKQRVTYDSAYRRIPYPGGDVPKEFGVCTDVIIRAYRQALGVDLQRLVHEDMKGHFSLYPKNWGLKSPDTNIDHRRVPNLRVFLARFGQSLRVSAKTSDYAPGDLVTYRLPFGQPHIALVSDHSEPDGMFGTASRPYMIIHNIGAGPKEEAGLMANQITGHYRFLI